LSGLGYGGPPRYLLAESAETLTPTRIRIVFNDLLDLSSPATTNVANYPISDFHVWANVFYPTWVEVETHRSVILHTSFLSKARYSTVPQNIPSYFGGIFPTSWLDFVGFAGGATFRPVPVSWRKVRLVFSGPMLVNSALTNPASYRVRTHTGVDLPITSVIPEGPSNLPVAVSLVLGADLIDRGVHTASVTSLEVQDILGHVISPSSLDLRWVAPTPRLTIPVRKFTGETRQGLLGRHNGLAFFSPALTTPAPNSAIQVDEVKVCTRAEDVYTIPNPPDPNVLFTFKRGVSTGTLATAGHVTFATFDRLGGARVDLHSTHQDTLAAPTDSRCIATLTETLEPARAPRLNAMAYNTTAPHLRPVWPLFDGVSSTPFATASNLTPIPPGTTTVRTLEP
jgi:hypothetical protein